jgi:hypothetical protein
MGRRVCPECGSDAVTNWLATTDFLEDLQSTIECPNGHGEITEEAAVETRERTRRSHDCL